MSQPSATLAHQARPGATRLAVPFAPGALVLSFLIAFGCGVVGYLVSESSQGAVPGLPLAAFSMLLIEGLLGRGAGPDLGPQLRGAQEGRVVVCLAMLGAAGAWAVAAGYALSGTFTNWDQPLGILVVVTPLLGLFTLIAGAAATLLARRPALAAGLVRGTSICAVVLGSPSIAIGFARSARFPDPHTYSLSLPRDGAVTAVPLDVLGPPRSWVVSALVGVLVAIVYLLRGSQARRRLAMLADAAEGTLGADGWVSFTDGRPPLRLRSTLPDVFDPADPRAPTEAQWAAMTQEERDRVVAMLDGAVGNDEWRLEELARRLAEAERGREEERRGREDAERMLAEALAEIERLKKPPTA